MKLLEAPRFIRINDSADDVFTVTDLSVVVTKLGQNIARFKVDQLPVNGCGPDIHGNGIISIGGIPRLNIYDVRLSPGLDRPGKGSGNSEAVFSQDVWNFPDNGKPNHQTVFVVFGFQKRDESGYIRQVIL